MVQRFFDAAIEFGAWTATPPELQHPAEIDLAGIHDFRLIRSHLGAVTPGSAQYRFVVLARGFADWSSGLYPLIPRRSLTSVVRMWSGWARSLCIVGRRVGERPRARLRTEGRFLE